VGAKTWMLVYSEGDAPHILAKYPEIDRGKTLQLVTTAFPKHKIADLEDTTLLNTCPPRRKLIAGWFPGVSILAAEEFGIDYPSKLTAHYVGLAGSKKTYLFAMHSVVDFFAFAVWESGVLTRSLSVSSESGIIEDIGDRLAFELPFWSGVHPAVDPEDDAREKHPLKFHPLELGDATLSNLMGFSMESPYPTDIVDPQKIQLMCSSRKKPFLGFFNLSKWH
jgi:hypothetical protein